MTRTWPVAVHRAADRTYIGLPDRLGDGRSYLDVSAPSLEELVGDHWSNALIARLLPTDRTWAWWVRTEVLRRSGLAVGRAEREVATQTLSRPVRRRLLWTGMSLTLIGDHDSNSREIVREWCASDTEAAEHIWTSPEGTKPWNSDAIIAWCRDPARWRDPRSVLTVPAERVLTAFDGYFFLAIGEPSATRVLTAIEELAGSWGLTVISGAAAHAWITDPTRDRGK